MGDESGRPNNFPEDLISEILCYLPVKSLIRFTIVCKSWFRLIRNDHQFAMKNYRIRTTSSSTVLDNVDYMCSIIRKSYTPCLYSFTNSKTFRFSTKFECLADKSIRIANSCHGIICFYFGRNEILLCNPLIQEVIKLPPCPTSRKNALGFDPIRNDYKVVGIDFPRTDDRLCTANVFCLRQGHWRKLHSIIFPRCRDDIKGDGASNGNGRFFNWLFRKELEYGKTELTLLSFDMVDEVLNEFPLPKCEHRHYLGPELLSSTLWQACLSCVHHRNVANRFVEVEVWVLDDWIWSKAIVVNLPDHGPVWTHDLTAQSNFWMNDNELFVNVDKGNTVEVFHYDLGTQQLKRTGSNGYFCTAMGYTESLVSLKRFMSVRHECNDDDQGIASKHKDKAGVYVLRQVSRKGVRWSRSFN